MMMDAQGQLPEVSFTAEDVDQPMDNNNNDNAAGSDSNKERPLFESCVALSLTQHIRKDVLAPWGFKDEQQR